jgi:basic membrane protein A
MKRFALIITAALATALVFTGCSKKEAATAAAPAKAATAAPSKDVPFYAYITDTGGVSDQSFNQSGWEGLKGFGDANKGKVRVAYLESHNDSEYATNLENFADQNAKIIFGAGYLLSDAFTQAGKDYPNIQFVLVDNAFDPASVPNHNVTGVVFHAEQSSFLAGYIAAKMSKTGKIGHVNGIASPTMEAFAVGYYAGALTANPNIKIMGQYSGSFSDPAAGKAIAKQFFADGADVIYAACGNTGNGAIDETNSESTPDSPKWVIGVDRDQNYLAPNVVLTSALKKVNVAVEDIAKEELAGTFKGGSTRYFDLKDGGVDIATTGNHIPAALLTEVNQVKADIIAGKIKVPATAAEINAQFPGKYDMPAVK